MKTLVSFAEQAREIVAGARAKYSFAKDLKSAFMDLAYALPAFGAGTDSGTYILGVVPANASQFSWQAVKCSVTSPSLVTGATANAVTFTFGYSRAGAAIVTIGTLVLSTGTNLTALTEVAATLVAAALSLQAGDVLTVATTHAGSGLALAAGTAVKVEVQ